MDEAVLKQVEETQFFPRFAIKALELNLKALCDRVNRLKLRTERTEEILRNKKVSAPSLPQGWVELNTYCEMFPYISPSDLSRIGRMWEPAQEHFSRTSSRKIAIRFESLHQLLGNEEFAKVCPKIYRKRIQWEKQHADKGASG